MLWRRSRTKRARRAAAGRRPIGDEVRDQVVGMTDELGDALETARDAITRAMSSAGRRGAEAGAEATHKTAALGKEAGRKGVAAGRKAGRRARGAAREVLEKRLPEPEQVAEMTRRATDKLLPERAEQRRKTNRKRRRRLLFGSAGVAGLGVLAGWLTAPKKGDEVRQALKERANAAGDKVAEMRAGASSQGPTPVPTTASGSGAESSTGGGGGAAGSGTSGPQGSPAQQSAEVTPIHQGDGSSASKRR